MQFGGDEFRTRPLNDSRGPKANGNVARILAMLFVLLVPLPLHAQPNPAPDNRASENRAPARSSPAAEMPAQKAAAVPAISPGQAQQLLDVLNDPKKRAAFTSTLTAMTHALPVAVPAPAVAAPAKVTLAPDSVGSELLARIGTVRSLVVTQAAAFGRMFGDVVLTTRWLHHEMLNPNSRAVLYDVAWRGGFIVLAALLVERGLFLLLRRPLRALARDSRVVQEAAPALAEEVAAALPDDTAVEPLAHPATPAADTIAADLPEAPPDVPKPAKPELPEGETPHVAETRARDATHMWRTMRLLRRVPFAVLRLLLKLLPVGAVLVIGNVAGGDIDNHPVTQLAVVTITNLYGIARVIYLALEVPLAADAPGVRLIGVTNASARLLTRWWVWLVAVPVAAVMVIDLGGLLNLPQRAAQSMIRAMLLVEHILLALLIWQMRERVADALSPPKRFRATGVGVMASHLVAYWWVPAVFFDFALWLVWAAQVQDGYARICRLFLISCVVIVACRLAGTALLGLLDRMFRVHPELEHRYPGLEVRANRYYPLIRRVVNGVILAVGAILLLQAWGLNALAWFSGGALGTRVVSAAISILVALFVGVLIWEIANASLDRQIASFSRAAQTARAVRLQTLLPILRTMLFIGLATIIILTVLSEIGVNVAPLLAGASIIGVALGFGSQKLVQDFITGIFLLMENAMQVGDTVTAAGVTGTVEHLSIRTLRLRGGDGSVQIIPFSSVSTVMNVSRDYAVAAIAISVAVEEDTDRVCTLLIQIGAELQQDAGFADFILADFALNGIDSIGEYAVALSGTIKCTVGGRWPVQREFYRRLRMGLQAHHISLPARPLNVPGLLPGVPAGLEHEPEKSDA